MQELKSGAAELGIELSASQLAAFEKYYRVLTEWNRKLNLTTITDYDEVQAKHFLDSLSVLVAGIPEDASVIDVGTGAGLPGVPVKIARPDIRLTLLEATGKKADFLKHLKQTLSLDDIEVVPARAEEAARKEAYREQFDIVLARALAPLPVLAELTLPFLKVGGRLIAQKKGDISEEIREAAKAIDVLGGRLVEVMPVNLKGLDDGRCLVIIEKIAATPGKYPRRPGMAAKRPIT
jgi:16S rRNA (guanine527-N7)-methyltransferase